jgi:hypothetical protein
MSLVRRAGVSWWSPAGARNEACKAQLAFFQVATTALGADVARSRVFRAAGPLAFLEDDQCHGSRPLP